MSYGDGGYYFLQPVNNGYGGIGYGLSPLPPGMSEGPHMSEAGNCPLYFKWKRMARKYSQAALHFQKAGKAKKARLLLAKANAAKRKANAERRRCRKGLHSHGTASGFGRVADVFMGQGVSKQFKPYPTSMVEKRADLDSLHGSLKSLAAQSASLNRKVKQQNKRVVALARKVASLTSYTTKRKYAKILKVEEYALKRLRESYQAILRRMQRQRENIETADRRALVTTLFAPKMTIGGMSKDPVGDAEGKRAVYKALTKADVRVVDTQSNCPPGQMYIPGQGCTVVQHGPLYVDPNELPGGLPMGEPLDAEEVIADEILDEPEIDMVDVEVVSDAADPDAPSFYEEHKQLISIGAGALGLVALIKLMKD